MKEESWGTREFKDCAVEDKREAKSIAKIADSLLAQPELSFSGSVGTASRKAAWRIFSKAEVDISYGHYKQTALRCEGHSVVLVSHDTTDISYTDHYCSEGLGDLGGGNGGVNLGLCLHSAMALNEQGLPLGLVGQKIWAPVATGRKKRAEKYSLEQKESYRWVEALQWVGQHLTKVARVVMISDRESDFYEYMIAPRAVNVELLFRAHHLQRHIYYNDVKMPLNDVVFSWTTSIEFLVLKSKKRKKRIAKLEVSWGKIICPPAASRFGKELTLWVVKTKEIDPPVGELPLEWVLLTTIAVKDEATAMLMLDYYRKRWVIERWHLVLKQGTQVERLQFDNFLRLSNAIALVSIVAWQLFCLKHLAAQNPDVSAEQVLEPLLIEVLKKQKGLRQQQQLSLQQALITIAALAGFIPSKKQPLPGEKTIWRGWFILTKICEGYKLAFQESYGTG